MIKECSVILRSVLNSENQGQITELFIKQSSYQTVQGFVMFVVQQSKTEQHRDKTNKVAVPPAKTQISLDICPV